MTIADHVWDVSPSADRVWAQVAGMAPSLIGRRLFLVLQGFFDESEGEDGTYVLAGHLASPGPWARLSREWERLLPFARPKPEKKRTGSAVQRFVPTNELTPPSNAERFHFKASEMAQSKEGVEDTRAFLRLIEEHTLISVSATMNRRDFESAAKRIVVPNSHIVWGDVTHIYRVAFYALMDGLVALTSQPGARIPRGAKFDLYFDERSDKHVVRVGWEAWAASLPEEVRARFGNEPRFEKDEEFLGLQAADLWAYWVRKWHSEGRPRAVGAPDLGGWVSNAKHIRADFVINEQDALGTLLNIVRTRPEGADAVVVEREFNPNAWKTKI